MTRERLLSRPLCVFCRARFWGRTGTTTNELEWCCPAWTTPTSWSCKASRKPPEGTTAAGWATGSRSTITRFKVNPSSSTSNVRRGGKSYFVNCHWLCVWNFTIMTGTTTFTVKDSSLKRFWCIAGALSDGRGFRRNCWQLS